MNEIASAIPLPLNNKGNRVALIPLITIKDLKIFNLLVLSPILPIIGDKTIAIKTEMLVTAPHIAELNSPKVEARIMGNKKLWNIIT